MMSTRIDQNEFDGLVRQFLPITDGYLRARIEMHGPSRVANYTVLNALAAVAAHMLQGGDQEAIDWFIGAVEDAVEK